MLEIKDLHKRFSEDAYPLKGVDLLAKDGEVVAVMGISGSGKSTILNCIAGIEIKNSGEIIIDDTPIDYDNIAQVQELRQTLMGIVFQQYYLLKNTTVFNQLKLATDASDKDIEEALDQMQIKEHMHKKIEMCSGGQQQRISIARALVKKPRLLLADEPTANLDISLALSAVDRMVALAKENQMTVVIITHDTRLLHLCDSVYMLKEGKMSPYENK